MQLIFPQIFLVVNWYTTNVAHWFTKSKATLAANSPINTGRRQNGWGSLVYNNWLKYVAYRFTVCCLLTSDLLLDQRILES